MHIDVLSALLGALVATVILVFAGDLRVRIAWGHGRKSEPSEEPIGPTSDH